MKLIESNVELLTQKEGLNGIYKQIELVGRTCYKSEDKITENSAKDFVDKMIRNGHTAMLEHGTIYLSIPINTWKDYPSYCDDEFIRNKFTYINDSEVDWKKFEGFVYITTNFRVILESNWLSYLKYMCEPTEFHERRISLKFTTDRGVSHELVRHRVFSFAQESTRYCDYSKNKFDNELTFIQSYSNYKDKTRYSLLIEVLQKIENTYMTMIRYNWTSQQVRCILPNCIKTEIVMTGFASDWKHFFDLRLFGTTGKPHPDMEALAEKARDILIKNDLWNLIYNPNNKTNN